MERKILEKLNSLRESFHTVHKGYDVKEDRDGNFIVSNMKGIIGTFESLDDATEYIDDIGNRGGYVKKPTLKYCVRISYPNDKGWNYLCKSGHYMHEKYVDNSRIRTFDSKNSAQQALKYSTRSIDYQEAEVTLWRQ